MDGIHRGPGMQGDQPFGGPQEISDVKFDYELLVKCGEQIVGILMMHFIK